jgi:hypothetical protein
VSLFPGPFLDALEIAGNPARNRFMQTALNAFYNGLSGADLTALERVGLTVAELARLHERNSRPAISEGIIVHQLSTNRNFVATYANLLGPETKENLTFAARAIEAAIKGFRP